MTLYELIKSIPRDEDISSEFNLYVKGAPVWDYKVIENKGISLIASPLSEDFDDLDIVNLDELVIFAEENQSIDNYLFSEDTGEILQRVSHKEGSLNFY